jgi:carbonic anhydrase
MQKNYRLWILLCIFVLWACAPKVEQSTSPYWAYEGEEGPEHWGELDPDFATCGTGTHQSPIDVSKSVEKDLTNLVFNYQLSELNILNNGHTVQVNYDEGSYLELDGVQYNILQFHYHTPSEHTVEGIEFSAELHVVHKNSAGKLAVISILLKEGFFNKAYQPFIDNLPTEKNDVQNVGVKIDVFSLLPNIYTTYRYNGSLTTPPCTEGVQWLVFTTPVQISSEQLIKLQTVFDHDNNRPVQPLNDRILDEDNTP